MKLVELCFALTAVLSFASARLIGRQNVTGYPPASVPMNGTRYAILDNDWGSTGFVPILMALGANMDVLGLASDTANTWVDQTTLHAVRKHVVIYSDQGLWLG